MCITLISSSEDFRDNNDHSGIKKSYVVSWMDKPRESNQPVITWLSGFHSKMEPEKSRRAILFSVSFWKACLAWFWHQQTLRGSLGLTLPESTHMAEDHGLGDGDGAVDVTQSPELLISVIAQNIILLDGVQGLLLTLQFDNVWVRNNFLSKLPHRILKSG